MKRSNYFCAVFMIAFMPLPSYAFFCPTNFNQISIGDTIAQVKQQCGSPAKEETRDAQQNVPQEWVYFVAQTVSMLNGTTPAQGTLRTSVSFDTSGKAINISVNGIGVGSSTICGGTIQLGDTQEAIKSACGKPAFINKQQPQTTGGTAAPTENKVIEDTYNANPPVVLQFQDGRLTGKK